MEKAASKYRLGRLALLGIVACAALLLSACGNGGGTVDDGPKEVDIGPVDLVGDVTIKDGAPAVFGDLHVTTPFGSYPVAADGKFTATTAIEGVATLLAEDGQGELLLIGNALNGTAVLSSESTALALVYYAVGGMFLPPEVQESMQTLIRDLPEFEIVTTEVDRLLAAGTNPLGNPDEGLTGALEAVQQRLLDAAGLGGLVSPQQDGAADEAAVLIHDGSRKRSGVQIVHDPDGSFAGAGIVALNSYRRPAALLVYEIARENSEGVRTDIDPPNLVAEVDVPVTTQLSILNSLTDVISGDAPFTPVSSEAVGLEGIADAAKTHYVLVLIGPSSHDSVMPIVSDPRFAGELERWNKIYAEKSLDLFFNEMLLPIIMTFAIGDIAKADAAKLASMRERMKIAYRTNMPGLSKYLSVKDWNYLAIMQASLAEIAENRILRSSFLEPLEEALRVREGRKFDIQAMDRRLAANARASAVTAAIQGVMTATDVSAILSNITSSFWADSWRAETAQALFILEPAYVELKANEEARATFVVEPRRQVQGPLLYRWSTSGMNGTISDYFQDGHEFDTDSEEVFYTHNRPSRMVAGESDTVTVKVFRLKEGTDTIPPGTEPIHQSTAQIVVVDDEEDDEEEEEPEEPGPNEDCQQINVNNYWCWIPTLTCMPPGPHRDLCYDLVGESLAGVTPLENQGTP